MINKKSDNLVILVATYNRLSLLKKSLTSIQKSTKVPYEIIVIDGGSTDDTVKYLKRRKDITCIFQGKLVGTSRAYNRVWRKIRCKYTCWLSDDTEITPGSLDLAVRILEGDKSIGMVGLKMRDTIGPASNLPYMGGISEYGILNCNHGVLQYSLLKSVGFFNESYRSYMIDPDLTASVLCTGKKVVMTKKIAVLHHREWAELENANEKELREMGGVDNAKVYRKKFKFLRAGKWLQYLRGPLGFYLPRIIFAINQQTIFGFNSQDVHNLVAGRFISIFDPIVNASKAYHLVQMIPKRFLRSPKNPYRKIYAD